MWEAGGHAQPFLPWLSLKNEAMRPHFSLHIGSHPSKILQLALPSVSPLQNGGNNGRQTFSLSPKGDEPQSGESIAQWLGELTLAPHLPEQVVQAPALPLSFSD